MIQIKSGVKGTSFNTADGEFYMSPQRDIAHGFPVIVQKALQMTSNKTDPVMLSYYDSGGTYEEIGLAARALARFTYMSADRDKHHLSVNYIATQSGWSALSPRVRMMVGYYIGMVTLSMYRQGIKEAMQGRFIPFQFGGPNDIDNTFVPDTKSDSAANPTPALPAGGESVSGQTEVDPKAQ